LRRFAAGGSVNCDKLSSRSDREVRGYARTTARDLAAESGANLASIGYHFGSKEALLNEALAEGMRGTMCGKPGKGLEPSTCRLQGGCSSS
jgi:hypothetical protein